MSESRIEMLRSGLNAWGYLSKEDGQELFAHIDALTRERDELKVACEKVMDVSARLARECESIERRDAEGSIEDTYVIAFADALVACRNALAATASGKGE